MKRGVAKPHMFDHCRHNADKMKFATDFTSVIFPLKRDLVCINPVYFQSIGVSRRIVVNRMFEACHQTMAAKSLYGELRRQKKGERKNRMCRGFRR